MLDGDDFLIKSLKPDGSVVSYAMRVENIPVV